MFYNDLDTKAQVLGYDSWKKSDFLERSRKYLRSCKPNYSAINKWAQEYNGTFDNTEYGNPKIPEIFSILEEKYKIDNTDYELIKTFSYIQWIKTGSKFADKFESVELHNHLTYYSIEIYSSTCDYKKTLKLYKVEDIYNWFNEHNPINILDILSKAGKDLEFYKKEQHTKLDIDLL